jgi:hypothetical protein
MMKRYLIGKLPEGAEGSEKAKTADATGAAPAAVGAAASDAAHGGSMWAYLIPIAILLSALYFQFFAPKKGESKSS